MGLTAGQSLTHYEILGPLGAGAMGEVYRARDTRLEREVAIKVLPEELAGDEERLARFEREARTLASLNHPNVAQIFGVDRVEDTYFLVLELVEGEGLDRRLARGPLRVDEAVEVCAQIADGLDAAHEAGVIHRDLKPANVRVTPAGKVKVLDFGLSKPREAGGESYDSVLSTEAGRLLGTPTYMAPEQARGQAVDRRIDLWALGCVLYECLTGRVAFGGESLGDVMATVLEREPDLGLLPAGTPAHVRDVLARCLQKDPRQRLRDAGDARLDLQRPAAAVAQVTRRGPGKALGIGASLLAAVLVGFALRAGLDPGLEPAPQPPVVRFALEGLGIPYDAFQGLALSPDGTQLAYRSLGDHGRELLTLRSRETGQVRQLPGTEYGWLPCFSPDGESLCFFSVGVLKTVSLTSGVVRTLRNLPAGYTGGAWLTDDTLLVTGGRRVWRLPAAGGELEEIELDLPETHELLSSPARLPLEDAFLVCVERSAGAFDLLLCTLDGQVTRLAEDAFSPSWSASGHVLYQGGAAGPLMALPFDLERRVPSGEPFAVVTDLSGRVSIQVRTYAVADDGTLAYFPTTGQQDQGALVWVDREGTPTPIRDFGRFIDTPRLSHDGTRVAFRAPAPECKLWVYDLERDVPTLFTPEADNHGLAWSPLDEHIATSRKGEGLWDVVVSNADGSGEPRGLTGPRISRGFVADYTPDGSQLLVITGADETGADLVLVNTDSGEQTALLESRFREDQASFSPNGRFFAYVSNESGQPEVYVQPFPATGARVQISAGGGGEPVWSRDGSALFFRHGRELLEVDVKIDGEFEAGRPRPLFSGDFAARGTSAMADYDVSKDGRRFLMISERLGQRGAKVNVVLNWFQELDAAGAEQGR